MSDSAAKLSLPSNAKFKELERDINFPAYGMTCKVIACPDMTHFTKYGQYMDHFVRVHHPETFMYRCSECERAFGNRRNARRHIKNHEEASLVNEPCPNSQYIDPGTVKVPQPPTKFTAPNRPEDYVRYRRMDQHYKRVALKYHMDRVFEEKMRHDREMDEIEREVSVRFYGRERGRVRYGREFS